MRQCPTGDFICAETSTGFSVRPSRRSAVIQAGGGLIFCVLFFPMLIWMASNSALLPCVAIPSALVMAFVVIGSVRVWLIRSVFLEVDRAGSVTYGEDQLVAPDSISQILLKETSQGEGSSNYDIGVVLTNKREVIFPYPYFSNLGNLQSAAWLAAAFARFLNVPIDTVDLEVKRTASLPPGVEASDPEKAHQLIAEPNENTESLQSDNK